MVPKFFVKVIAPDKTSIVNLRKYKLDLFRSTATSTQEKKFTIDGLVTLDEVGRLVEDGYRVIVEEESSRRARSQIHAVGFKEWIKSKEKVRI
jgi:hypothetical protein